MAKWRNLELAYKKEKCWGRLVPVVSGSSVQEDVAGDQESLRPPLKEEKSPSMVARI